MIIDLPVEHINPAYRKHLYAKQRTQIFYGGSSSGKSVFLAQRAIIDLLNGGRNYLICRQVGRTLRRSVFNELQKIINEWRINDLFTINLTEQIITATNGYQILFSGLDDPEKIKSITPAKGVITDVWIEEATETQEQAIKQLYKRLRGGSDKTAKRLTMSFNPILRTHWIYQSEFSPIAWTDDQRQHVTNDLLILKTTYRDNTFLTQQDRDELEKERDSYFYDVYTLGNWGVLGDIIFTNWRTEELKGKISQFTNHRDGLDFGFASDPAAFVATHYDRANKTIYIYDELYERGLTNDVLAEQVRPLAADRPFAADSAEPKSIKELQRYGLRVFPTRKGQDSVWHGIQWLQQQTILIDPRCINTRNEFQQYQWRKDRDGNAIRQPVDKNNHAIDALRYAYEEEIAGGTNWGHNPLAARR
jgi:phage terminase large subunit